MDVDVTSEELAEAIIDRLFPMIDGQARAVRVQDTQFVIDDMCGLDEEEEDLFESNGTYLD